MPPPAPSSPAGTSRSTLDHMEAKNAPTWGQQGSIKKARSAGAGRTAPTLKTSWRLIWYDAPARRVRFKRSTVVTLPDGRVLECEFEQQEHPGQPPARCRPGWGGTASTCVGCMETGTGSVVQRDVGEDDLLGGEEEGVEPE